MTGFHSLLYLLVAALKHFMCKHVARMRAARNEAKTLQSIAAFRARRLCVMTSLILGEKTELRTLYKYASIISGRVQDICSRSDTDQDIRELVSSVGGLNCGLDAIL